MKSLEPDQAINPAEIEKIIQQEKNHIGTPRHGVTPSQDYINNYKNGNVSISHQRNGALVSRTVSVFTG